MIKPALSFCLDHLPINVIPLFLKSGLVIFQQLIPLRDRIGLLLSRGWDTIMSYNVGELILSLFDVHFE